MFSKSVFLLGFAFFVFSVSDNYCQNAVLSDELLYKDLPFKMEPVKQPVFSQNLVNIKDFGAVSDGIFSNTKAIAAAIDAVVLKGGGTVVIPEGLWLTGPITLKSNVNLYTKKGAIVRFSSDYNEYPLVKTWYEGSGTWRAMSPINAEGASNIAVTGEGIFDGNGDAWRPIKRNNIIESRWKNYVLSGGVVNDDKTTWYPAQSAYNGSRMISDSTSHSEKDYEAIKVYLRPVMVNFLKCNSILFDGVTFQNPPAWTIHPLLSNEIIIRNVKIFNEEWQTNADAIDIESCRNVIISNCIIDAGDDGICMKSGKDVEGRIRGVPTENIIVSNCLVYKGHGGFVVGSEMSGDVRNIKVSNCSFMGTDNGLRFKSTRGRGGVVENIYISDINMVDIERDAILFDLYYAIRDAKNAPIPVADESTPVFRNIHMKNIICKGANRAILLQGLPEMNLQDISLENAVIEAQRGIYCGDARQIVMKNVRIYSKDLPVVEMFNASNVSFTDFVCQDSDSILFKISGANCGSISLQKISVSKDKIEISPEVEKKKVVFLP